MTSGLSTYTHTSTRTHINGCEHTYPHTQSINQSVASAECAGSQKQKKWRPKYLELQINWTHGKT